MQHLAASRVLSARFPLAHGADAIRELRDRKAMGKVVVTIP